MAIVLPDRGLLGLAITRLLGLGIFLDGVACFDFVIALLAESIGEGHYESGWLDLAAARVLIVRIEFLRLADKYKWFELK